MSSLFSRKWFYAGANMLLFSLVVITLVFEFKGISGFMPLGLEAQYDQNGSFVSIEKYTSFSMEVLYALLFLFYSLEFFFHAGDGEGADLDRHDRKLADTHIGVAVAFSIGRIASARSEHWTAVAFAFFQVTQVHNLMTYFETRRAIGYGKQIFRGGDKKVFIWNWVYAIAPVSLHHLGVNLTSAIVSFGFGNDLKKSQDWAVAAFVVFAALTYANEHPIYRISQLVVTVAWIINTYDSTRLLATGCVVSVYIVWSLAKLILTGDWRMSFKGDSNEYHSDETEF